MLNENNKRAIMPAQIAPLVKWDKLEGCVILCLGKDNESNHLVMSSVTFNELTLLHTQLGSYLNDRLSGSLIEGLPFEEVEIVKN